MNAHLLFEAVAITIVFVQGTIFRRLRESGPRLWQELAACPLCIGVWIGCAWSLLHARPLVPSATLAADVLAAGAATGVVALVVKLLIGLLMTLHDRSS